MNDVLEFWFNTVERSDWFKKSDELDARIKTLFQTTHQQIMVGEMAHWRETADGRLAEIIVLDQFSRNMFRGLPESFGSDHLALALAQEAVRSGADQGLDDAKRTFMYMPFMHSESQLIHQHAMELFKDLPALEHEIKHKVIIDQFGRYPHRNAVLGRESSAEETEWLQTNSGF